MLLITLTLILLAAWYLFASGLTSQARLSTRGVLAGVGATGQIAVTCMVLGVMGWLTPAAVSAVSLVIAAGLVTAALRIPSRGGVQGPGPKREPGPEPRSGSARQPGSESNIERRSKPSAN